MATRETKLRIGVETAGAGDIAALAADVTRLGEETKQAAAASKAAAGVEAAAVADRRAAREALNAQRDALSLLKIETTGAARATDAYRQAETALLLSIREGGIAVRAKQAAVNDAAAAARAARDAEAALVAQADKVATAYRQAAAAASAAAREQQQAAGSVGASLTSIKGQLETLRNLAGAALGGSLIGSLAKDVAETADSFANLQARIKLVTGDGPALASAFNGVLEVTQRTNSTLEGTGTLFARILESGKSIGLAQADALRLTESINQAVQISGSSAQASDAAITQLIQGLQSGVVRGEEFNSVMEQAPRLAQALADGLAVTKGELRKLAEQGTLTSQTVITALQGQSQTLQREFGQLPATVGRAITNLSTAWTIYVGETDKATGASSKAAGAINLLAANLDTLGSLLYAAGKAGAALAAVNLAKGFLASAAAASQAAAATTTSTAATVAATRATVVDTTARAANTAAVVAGAQAATGAATATGRFAAAVSTIKTVGLAVVLTSLEQIGTAIGEGAARLFGYGRRIDEVDAALRKEAEATRAAAVAKAALAQRTEQASNKALGLTEAARKLVGEFDGLRQKSETVADSLDKVTKSLKLDDISGIQAAGAALDALALSGKISADQVRDALSAALMGDDLIVFGTKARAAFGSSEQGARRLQAALDAVANESLRRAGTSVDELRTGFSSAMNSAVNDVDTLAATLDKLGVKGEDAARLLSTSLGKALDTATSEKAVQAVIDRLQALGNQGKITGETLALSLARARDKLDDLKPGISSLDEAFRRLGVLAPAELKRIADANEEAFERIKNDGTTALAIKRDAFKVYADSAIAANNGVATSTLKTEARMLGLSIQVDKTGKAIVEAMDVAGDAVDNLGRRVNAAGEALDQLAGSLSDTFTAETKARNDKVTANRTPGATYDAGGFATDPSGARITASSGTLAMPSTGGPWRWVASLNQGHPFGGYWQSASTGEQFDGSRGTTYRAGKGFEVVAGAGASTSTAAAAPASTPAASSTGGGYTVTVNLNGKRSTIATASRADADALAELLQQLEDSAGAGG